MTNSGSRFRNCLLLNPLILSQTIDSTLSKKTKSGPIHKKERRLFQRNFGVCQFIQRSQCSCSPQYEFTKTSKQFCPTD